MKLLLLACLRGNIFLYNGEELGLTQVDIPFERLRDPEAIANWPLTLSRDGARTPLPWRADAPGLGFSAAEPWLPFGVDHAALAIDRQDADPASLLAWTRAVLALRNRHTALRRGSVRIVTVDDDLLVFERRTDDETLLCAFNFSTASRAWQPDVPGDWTLAIASDPPDGEMLAPASGLVLRRNG
jgi:alpha-glucosidase